MDMYADSQFNTSLFAALALAFFPACGDSEPPLSTFSEVTDSAGVTLVETSGDPWARASGWTVVSSPSLVIGQSLNGPDDALFQVQGAVRLADGTVIVANGGSHELKWYDRNGTFLMKAGRKGGGPDEFESIRLLARYRRDSIAVWDQRNQRISIFSEDGQFGRAIGFRHEGSVIGVIDGHSFLVQLENSMGNDGLLRFQTTGLRYTPETARVDTLGFFQGTERIVSVEQTATRFRTSEFPRPFGRTAVFASSGSFFAVGTQDAFEIEVHSSSGGLVSVVRARWPNRRVTNEMIEAFKRTQLATVTSPKTRETLSALDNLPYPDFTPAYGAILVDDIGNLWVERYHIPGDIESLWTVFDQDLHMLGAVAIPRFSKIYQIGSDFILGGWKNSSDVEIVGVHVLNKH